MTKQPQFKYAVVKYRQKQLKPPMNLDCFASKFEARNDS